MEYSIKYILSKLTREYSIKYILSKLTREYSIKYIYFIYYDCVQL